MAATTVPENTTKRHAGRTSGPGGGAARTGLSRKVRQNLQAHGFLIGALLCFLMFSWYPMIREFIMSFQETKRGTTSWVGFKNLNRVYHDPYFWTAWKNTAEFTLYALVIGFLVPFVVAIVLNELRHARAYLRVLVYLPVMLPPVAACAALQVLLQPGLRALQPHSEDAPSADVTMAGLVPHGDDLGGHRGHLDEHGRRHPDLSGRVAEHPRRALRGRRPGRQPAC